MVHAKGWMQEAGAISSWSECVGSIKKWTSVKMWAALTKDQTVKSEAEHCLNSRSVRWSWFAVVGVYQMWSKEGQPVNQLQGHGAKGPLMHLWGKDLPICFKPTEELRQGRLSLKWMLAPIKSCLSTQTSLLCIGWPQTNQSPRWPLCVLQPTNMMISCCWFVCFYGKQFLISIHFKIQFRSW